jgi:hypothetical protein
MIFGPKNDPTDRAVLVMAEVDESQTHDLLGRAVHLDVSSELSSENLEELADALN